MQGGVRGCKGVYRGASGCQRVASRHRGVHGGWRACETMPRCLSSNERKAPISSRYEVGVT